MSFDLELTGRRRHDGTRDFPLTHTLACTIAADIHDVLKIREFLG